MHTGNPSTSAITLLNYSELLDRKCFAQQFPFGCPSNLRHFFIIIFYQLCQLSCYFTKMLTHFYMFPVIHRVSNLEYFLIHLLNFPHAKFLAIFFPLVTLVIFTSRASLIFLSFYIFRHMSGVRSCT